MNGQDPADAQDRTAGAASSPPPLTLVRDAGVATITLSRPEAANTIDLPMAEALKSASSECDRDANIRCVIIQAVGKLFCGGGDVRSFAAAGEKAPELIENITAHLHDALATFAQMRKPLVTIVQGPAAGAGVSLAALGDIAIASRRAHFSLAYGALGLTPDGGTTWLLPRLIGLRKTQELVLLNRRLPAEEAAEIGLITRAVDHEVLAAEAGAITSQLASAATNAIGRSRLLLLEAFQSSLGVQMEREAREIANSMATSDGVEGVLAFLSKRRPEFLGS